MRAGKRQRTEGLVLLPFPTREALPADGDLWEFIARQPDPETASRHHRTRSYDPTPARWTMEDPVGFAAGDANVYRYAGDGPTDADDGPGRSPS